MTASPADLSAFISRAMSLAGPIREQLDQLRKGFVPIHDALTFVGTLLVIGVLRAEAERLASEVDCPEFSAWVEMFCELEANLQTTAATMKLAVR